MAKLQFEQPDKLFHKYVTKADSVPGYQVEKVDDGKWTATFNGEPVTSKVLKTRAEALRACDDHHDPSPERLTNKDAEALNYIQNSGGECPTSELVSDGTLGLQPNAAVTVVRYLWRRELVLLSEDEKTISVTEKGLKALAGYQPKEVTITPKIRVGGYHGERPDWAVPPSKFEIAVAKLALARARKDLQYLDLRQHPFSEIAKKKYDKTVADEAEATKAYDKERAAIEAEAARQAEIAAKREKAELKKPKAAEKAQADGASKD